MLLGYSANMLIQGIVQHIRAVVYWFRDVDNLVITAVISLESSVFFRVEMKWPQERISGVFENNSCVTGQRLNSVER
jgi:hypothetical protein